MARGACLAGRAAGGGRRMSTRDARALDLFERTLELPAADRWRFLEQECADNEALLALVRRLLEADADPHPVLDSPPESWLADLLEPSDRWEGRRLGPYRLVKEIGRGGMGVVFMAERADVGTRVALKLLAGTLTTSERIARFDYERRVLARLDHPHIARFLDAGVTDDGTPWYAMEYVEGSPIDAHADARCLSVRERVCLLEHVTDAVAHAHRNLLVHRDLKPSNILVSDAGIPKLVDFGIATLLSAVPANGSPSSEKSCGPMTPEYASPEQMRCDAITTASDVYQLGITLHELLTGRRLTREDGQPLHDCAVGGRMIPASRLAGMEVQPRQLPGGLSSRTARELASLRGATPAQLSRSIAGDLDAILAVALHAEPARRYASAHEFADDLRRYRTGRAVTARAGSLPYRAGRFLRRHAIASALAFGLVVVLATSMVALWQQARRLAVERDRAEQVSRTLDRVVRRAAPGPQSGDNTAARTILAEVTAEGLVGLAFEPEMWARILDPVADIYAATTSPDTAIMIWRAIIAALDGRVPRDDPVLMSAVGGLGVRMIEEGDFAGGLAMLEQMLDDARRLPEERRDQFAYSLSLAAFGRQVTGDDAGAKRLYEETLAVAATLPDSAGRTWDRTLLNLGWLLGREGDISGAVTLLRGSLERRIARDGREGAGTVNAMAGLAHHLLELDSLREAAPLVDSVMAIRQRIYPPPNAMLAEALGLKSTLLNHLGRHADAEAVAREALDMHRGLYGDEHFLVAFAQANLAFAIAEQGRMAEALELQREAVARYRRTAGDHHPATAAAIIRRAELEREMGRDVEAELLYAEAIATLDSIAPGKPVLSRPLAAMGRLLAETERCARAEPFLRRALSLAHTTRDSAAAMATLRVCGER